MRVISGKARGRKLLAPDGLDTRPTADRIKESLFNMMAADLFECQFLDLFSGTGAIGIEALSRGACHAVFVEHRTECVSIINQNLEATKLKPFSEVICADYLQAISSLGASTRKFDIIFLDPPYAKGFSEKSIEAILQNDLLQTDGMIVLEIASNEVMPQFESLNLFKQKQYKTTSLLFYQLITQ